MSFALTGDAAQGWTPARLREFADNEVQNRLKTVPDVYSVVPFGGFRRQMQVIVDREKLAAYGLSILDVKKALDEQNVSRPAGNLTTNEREAIVRVDNRALRAEDILNYPIKQVETGTQFPNSASALHPRCGARGGWLLGTAQRVSFFESSAGHQGRKQKRG